MERLERFKKAIEYLKPKAEESTNEGVSKLLKYKTKNYISDVIGGSKEITPFLLERMVEFSINPEWIETGKGEMLAKKDNDNSKNGMALKKSNKEYTVDDYIMEKDARISDLKEFNDKLFDLVNSNLGDISKVQQAIFAMVRTLQQHEAVITSSGNKKREAEMLNTISKLNGDNLKVDAKQDNAVYLNKVGKA